MFMKRTRAIAAVAAAALLSAVAGCSNRVANEVAAMNTSNIQRLSNMYAAFQNFRGGRGPKDEAEFKTFIREFSPNKLSMMGIDPNNSESAFTSERDGQPFKVRYHVGGGRGAVAAVIFEQQGKDGTKQVGFTGGDVQDVDDATYQQLWTGKGPSEPPAAPPSTTTGPRGRATGRPPGAPTGPQ
jgi:hypothetical protein